jgi:hypothetical protein
MVEHEDPEMEFEGTPKMTFEELRTIVLKDPRAARRRIELL